MTQTDPLVRLDHDFWAAMHPKNQARCQLPEPKRRGPLKMGQAKRDQQVFTEACDELESRGLSISFPMLAHVTGMKKSKLWLIASILRRGGRLRWTINRTYNTYYHGCPIHVPLRKPPMNQAAQDRAADPQWIKVARSMARQASSQWRGMFFEEFESEAIFALCLAARAYQGKGEFGPYLRSYIRYAFKDFLKRKGEIMQPLPDSRVI